MFMWTFKSTKIRTFGACCWGGGGVRTHPLHPPVHPPGYGLGNICNLCIKGFRMEKTSLLHRRNQRSGPPSSFLWMRITTQKKASDRRLAQTIGLVTTTRKYCKLLRHGMLTYVNEAQNKVYITWVKTNIRLGERQIFKQLFKYP